MDGSLRRLSRARRRSCPPVVSAGPRLIGLDDRNALCQRGSEYRVVQHRRHIVARVLENSERSGADFERHVRNAFITVNHPEPRLRHPGQHAVTACRNRLALADDGSAVPKSSLSDHGTGGKPQLDDDAGLAVADGVVPHLGLNAGRSPWRPGRTLGRPEEHKNRKEGDYRACESRRAVTGHMDLFTPAGDQGGACPTARVREVRCSSRLLSAQPGCQGQTGQTCIQPVPPSLSLTNSDRTGIISACFTRF